MREPDIKILENKWLHSGTIMVSSDIAKLLREQYTKEAIDKNFLKTLGILISECKEDENDTKNR